MKEIIFYFDYKSPFSFLAKDLVRRLEGEFAVRLTWRPFIVDIPTTFGDLDDRTETQWRKVKYLYVDARRWANRRGLTIRGPQKIFDSRLAGIGMLYAQRHDAFHGYNDRVFERFFKRELDIEDRLALETVLAEAGADPGGFADFATGEGRTALDRCNTQGTDHGVFGVPSFVVDDELYFGHDRIDLLRDYLDDNAARPQN